MPVSPIDREVPAAASTSSTFMGAVPHRERRRILTGMRWTVWLSVLAAPFSYGTSVLLARVGPEVIGTYGLLLIYVSAASSLLYLGGDAVTIKFVPSLAVEKRLSFLASYFLVICGSLIPWIIAATFWPASLHYVFGKQITPSFQLLIIYLAPIYIARTLVISGLTAVLDMRWAQALNRIVTIGTFVLYGVLYAAFPAFLRAHYTALVWGVYLGLALITFAVGMARLMRMEEWMSSLRSVRFFLPAGFWKYTLALQQMSVLGFFVFRLDMLLVLNRGGLELLGKYVAIVTVASTVWLANRLFCDTLLPALTNLLAAGQTRGAAEVFAANLRMLFAVHLTVVCAGMFLMEPLIALMGAQYSSERALFKLLILLFAMSGPGGMGGTLLTAVGKQQLSVWLGVFQLVLFISAFTLLWPKYQLLGAVLAIGGATILCQIGLLAISRYQGPLIFPWARDYFCFIVIGGLAGWAAIGLGRPGLLACILGCTVPIGTFLFVARYKKEEILGLLNCLLPGRLKNMSKIGEHVDG